MYDYSDNNEWKYEQAKGCGCGVGAIVACVVFIFTVVWMGSHAKQVHALIAVACACVALWLARAPLRAMFHRARGLDPTAVPVPLASVKVGEPTHTTGLVGIGEKPHHAPLGAPAMCVFHRVVIEGIESRKIVIEVRSSDDLVLEDGMGARVRVHLDGARLLFTRHHDLVSSPEVVDPLIAQFLAERGIEVDHPVRARVEWIAPHELVFVRGVVKESTTGEAGYRTSERTDLEMRAAPGEPVLVSLEELSKSARA